MRGSEFTERHVLNLCIWFRLIPVFKGWWVPSAERFELCSASRKIPKRRTVFVKPYVAYRSGSWRTRLVIHKLRHSGRLRLNAASFWTNECWNPAGSGAACSETRLLCRRPLTQVQLSISNRFIVLCDVTQLETRSLVWCCAFSTQR